MYVYEHIARINFTLYKVVNSLFSKDKHSLNHLVYLPVFALRNLKQLNTKNINTSQFVCNIHCGYTHAAVIIIHIYTCS